MTYAVTVENGTALHAVEGDIRDVRSFSQPVTTICGRTVRPFNVFLDLDDYRKSYNVNGRLCANCERRLS